MAATKPLKEVLEEFPDFDPGWNLYVNGQPVDTGDWQVKSPFGEVNPVVVMHDDGTPNFCRPSYSEAPHSNFVAWGRAKDGNIRIAVIRQPRPHANDPYQPGVDGHDPIVFGQVPMGFIGRVFGVEIEDGETLEEALERQAAEETGAKLVLGVTRPAYPYHNPNSTFVETWAELAFVEVDLDVVEKHKYDRREPIYSAEFILPMELLYRIRTGVDNEGAIHRMCTANSVWLIFFATFPELWPRIMKIS